MPDESGHYTSINGQRLTPNQYLVRPKRTPEMQPTQQQGPPPANKMLAQMSDRALKGIDQKYAPAFKELQTALEYEVRRINEQFDIKQRDMYRLFTSESDPAKKKAIESRMLTAKNAAQARIADVRSKQRPAADQLNAARQQEIQTAQRKMQDKNTALQAVEGMVQAKIVSKAAATQWAYAKVLGISMPLSEFKPKQATLEQEKTAIEDDIRDITKLLKDYDYKPATGKFRHLVPGGKSYGTSTLIDPVTNKRRAATKEEAKQLESLKKIKGQKINNYQSLLMESDPRFRTTIERDRQNRDASKALTGGARPNLETAIRSAVGKTNKRVRVQSPSGQTGTVTEKELATYLAQGFKRI